MDYLDFSKQILTAVREKSPLVGCITNSVVTNFTANALLAIGAAPAMVDIVGEAGLFAGVSNGVLINLGTPTPEQRNAALESAAGANEANTPWVLDPVAVGGLPVRTATAVALAELNPTVIRGNASEIIALSGAGSGGRGVDSAHNVESALEAANNLALAHGSVIAVSGPVDAITDGKSLIRVSGGSEMITRITGGGCALGALTAAFCGVGFDILPSTVAVHVVYSAAAEIAAKNSSGPGSFAVAFLDALYSVTPDDLSGIEVSK